MRETGREKEKEKEEEREREREWEWEKERKKERKIERYLLVIEEWPWRIKIRESSSFSIVLPSNTFNCEMGRIL